ncbi:hypothetical protein CsSME_00049190 [Camellia sinensis var. sinensis]
MKSISLAKLGLNEVYGDKLMASPTEAKIYQHTKLNVEPKHEVLSSAPAKQDESNDDESKDNEGSDNSDGISGNAMDLNDVKDDINTSFNNPNIERGIIVAQPSEPDIVDVLIKENQKAWGLVRQWETKYKQLEKSWELRARSVHIITQVEAQKAHDSLKKHPIAPLKYILSPRSKVKRIKQKVRKEHRLDEFQYPDLPSQTKEKEGVEEQSHTVYIVQDLDKHPQKKNPTKYKKLTLTNKLKVWANISKFNKQKVQNLHKNSSDE